MTARRRWRLPDVRQSATALVPSLVPALRGLASAIGGPATLPRREFQLALRRRLLAAAATSAPKAIAKLGHGGQAREPRG